MYAYLAYLHQANSKRKFHEQAGRINSCAHNRKEIVACEGIIKSKSENEKKLNIVVKELQARCKEYIKDKNCVTDLIQTQFSVLESKLATKIEEAINTKLPQKKSKIHFEKSFAEMTKPNDQLNIPNIKKLLRSEKVEEQMEDQRKQLKDASIIIHGVKENEKEGDDIFVDELLQDVRIKTQSTTYVSRTGRYKTNQSSI